MQIPVLDHGYVKVIRAEGTDDDIAQTARTSSGSTGDVQANERLVKRLIRDRHTSPVEFVGFVFEIKAPIFVARQWFRHRSSTYNEWSGRYDELLDEFYFPELDRIQAQSTFNKQGSAEPIDPAIAEQILGTMRGICDEAYDAYQQMLGAGLTRELARIVLPVNIYTKYRWRVNLHNLFHFLSLRDDPHAQYEIREYAKVIAEMCEAYFPVATIAYNQHIKNSKKISPEAIQILKSMIDVESITNSELKDLFHYES